MASPSDGMSNMNQTHTYGFGPTKFNNLLKKKSNVKKVKATRHASVKPVPYGAGGAKL